MEEKKDLNRFAHTISLLVDDSQVRTYQNLYKIYYISKKKRLQTWRLCIISRFLKALIRIQHRPSKLFFYFTSESIIYKIFFSFKENEI
jgi:hypothetical protein